MKCPSCAAAAADDAVECPACGLIFAKWRERQEKEKLAAAEALKVLQEGPPEPAAAFDPWRGRAIAGAVVLAWVAALAFYVHRHGGKRKAPLGVDTGTFVELRDPKTGDMRRMPVRSLAVPSRPAPIPPGEDSSSGQ